MANVKFAEGKKKRVVQGQDGLSRINYLYQAAMHVVLNQPENVELARYYIKTLREVKEKKTFRLSLEMRRTICDGCNMLLIPGITSNIRVRSKCRMVITCLSCNTIKRVNTLQNTPDIRKQNMSKHKGLCRKIRMKKKKKQERKKKQKGDEDQKNPEEGSSCIRNDN